MTNLLDLYIKLPPDIIKLIEIHLNALTIQNIFKTNRPLTNLQIGDRIITNTEIKKINKLYGTIIDINNDLYKIKLLPRIIPHWKRCNISFWKCFENLLNYSNISPVTDIIYNFPYYIPKTIIISKNNLIKLHSWNVNNINDIYNIDSNIRLNNYFNNNVNKCKMFNYIF